MVPMNMEAFDEIALPMHEAGDDIFDLRNPERLEAVLDIASPALFDAIARRGGRRQNR
jgi:hypothetical protein